MAEKVLIIHEDEASVLWNSVQSELKNTKWDPTDEESYCHLTFLKNLERKIQKYLDNEPSAKDVSDLTSERDALLEKVKQLESELRGKNPPIWEGWSL